MLNNRVSLPIFVLVADHLEVQHVGVNIIVGVICHINLQRPHGVHLRIPGLLQCHESITYVGDDFYSNSTSNYFSRSVDDPEIIPT